MGPLGRRTAIVVCLLPVAAVWLLIMPHTPTLEPREVARAEVSCGDLLVTQMFTGTVEPYIVWLYYKAPGETDWGQFFVDDEAPYWWGGLDASGDAATLTLYGKPVGQFTCDGRAFRAWSHDMPQIRRVADPFDAKSTQRHPLPSPWFGP